MVKWLSTLQASIVKANFAEPPKPCLISPISGDNLKYLAYNQSIIMNHPNMDKTFDLTSALSAAIRSEMYGDAKDVAIVASYLVHKAELLGYVFDLTSILEPTGASKTIVDNGSFMGENFTTKEETTKITNSAYKDRDELKSLVCNDKLCVIGKDAFKGCRNLTSVKFTNNVVYIGPEAFSGCNLSYLDVPGSIDIVQRGCFRDNEHLMELKLNNGLQGIDEYAFTGCSSLLELDLPETLDYLSKGAFALCYGLTELCLGNVKVIDDYCFYRCRSLTSVSLPETVVKLGANVFSECVHLEKITLYDNIADISPDALKGLNKDVKVLIKQKDGIESSMLIAHLNRYHINYEVI